MTRFSVEVKSIFYLRVVAPLAALVPAWFAYGLAIIYADASTRFDKASVQEVLLCLEHVIGQQLCSSDRASTVRDYYRNRACARVDAMRLTGNGHRLTSLVRLHGEEHLRSALAHGKGAILCGAHYCSPRSLAGILGATGWPVTMVTRWTFGSGLSDHARKQRVYQLVWRPIEHHLRRKNITAWKGKISVAVEVANILRKNEFVLTNVDTRVLGYDRRRAISVNFMNGQALVLQGPVFISRLTGAPLLPAFVHRSRDWRHLEVEIHPEIKVNGNGTSEMQTLLTIVESLIRRDPAQWELWSMRSLVRLGLYPEDRAIRFYQSVDRHWGEL